MHIRVDHLSRKAFISTSKNQTTRDFISLIERVTHGREVGTILADQYSALNSRDLKGYLGKRKIQLLFTSVNNPESNGLNERLNQSLVNRIRCRMNSETKRAWPVIVNTCVDEYNKTVHSVTRFSPDYLMDGRTSEIIPQQLATRRNLEEDRAMALLNSKENFKRNKKRVDKNRRDVDIKVNDYVFVENGSKLNRNKLAEVRIGPFRVLREVSDSMFEMDSGKQKRKSNIFHKNKLVPIANK